jgi:Bacterial Ig domain
MHLSNRFGRSWFATVLVLMAVSVISLVGAPRDRKRPGIALTAPVSGVTVSGTITVSGTASDNVAVANVDVRIDNGAFSPATGTNSWSFSWLTTAVPDGSHSITARATDTSGNTSSASITVSVLNATPPPPPPPPIGTAAGTIPFGLPKQFTVGLYEEHGQTWMRDSGVPWDTRYRYFTYGWVNNWGWGAYDGSWGLSYLQECDSERFIPVVQYYVMNGLSNYNESAFLSTAQNASKMTDYFNEWKILMQRVKDFGKPAVILVEADGFGFLEQQSGGNSSAYAAVAATGMPELSSLPNTVAGWGMAFLQLRKAVGASNAILAMDISGWGTGKDLLYFSVTDSLSPEVDTAYNFLAPLGLSPNQTGATWDLLSNNPLDRDSDYYTTLGQNRWWDPSDTASISSKSFNRYAEWLRLWNVKAAKRWVLWQVPLGNSNHLDVYNNGNPREGYKDNRPEYFFQWNGAAHRQKFADDGVIGLMYGAGASGMSFYTNDVYTDGQLFMKSRAGAFLSAGGLIIN